MTTLIPFTKVHACANDFVLLSLDRMPPADRQRVERTLAPACIQAICDRRTGIGCDGILVLDHDQTGWHARILNADGSDGGMCGNGLRCIARFLLGRGDIEPGSRLSVRMGGRQTILQLEPGSSFRCSLDLGVASLDGTLVQAGGEPTAGVIGERVCLVWTGNPHAVVFVPPNQDAADLTAIARALRTSGRFAHGVNVTLARITGASLIHAETDERGVGPTKGCASGAVATAAAAHSLGLIGEACTVRMPGGDLEVALQRGACNPPEYRAEITGGAELVFEGLLPLPAPHPRA